MTRAYKLNATGTIGTSFTPSVIKRCKIASGDDLSQEVIDENTIIIRIVNRNEQ